MQRVLYITQSGGLQAARGIGGGAGEIVFGGAGDDQARVLRLQLGDGPVAFAPAFSVK